MAYVDITSVSYNAKQKYVLIEGLDLEQILMSNDWEHEFTDNAEVTFKFDLNSRGARVYLYKVMRTQVKTDECKSMQDMLNSLSGKMLNISDNFIAKTKG